MTSLSLLAGMTVSVLFINFLLQIACVFLYMCDFYSCVGCDCYKQLFKVTKKVLHCMCLLADFKVKRKAKIRNGYNQESHLTRDSIWETEEHTQENTTHKRDKMSVFSQQVITVLQGTEKTAIPSLSATENIIEDKFSIVYYNVQSIAKKWI